MSDSETENREKEKLTTKKLQKSNKSDSSSEDDVYAFSESENESDKDNIEMADSDVEGQENSDYDLPNSKAWGKTKRSFYSTDYVDKDYGGFGDDEEAALMEEKEAKNIQKRLLEQLEEDDFKLDFISPLQPTLDDKKETVIISDLSQMSKREKMQIMVKENPEFAGLIEDFKSKLLVAKDDFQPVLKLIKAGTMPKCMASKFIKTNYDLILNYCTNISVYILLKSQRVNIQNHPIIKRLYQYRQMLNKMEPVYIEVVKPQVQKIIKAVYNNSKLKVKEKYVKHTLNKGTTEQPCKKLKLINNLVKDGGEDTKDYDDCFKSGNNELNTAIESEESGVSDNEEVKSKRNQLHALQNENKHELGVKREITYQIAKNKGLTPHRKKEQRNPRVKHKLKYRKAKIRRKGAIREPRTEVNRYAGEASGIKTNVKKSIKIK